MINKWEIYLCDLNPTIGSEQRGRRPVLVVSNNAVNHNLSISTVLPISSIKEGKLVYPTEIKLSPVVTNLPLDSVAMVQQIRTVSQQRLVEKVGEIIEDQAQLAVNNVIKDYFEV